MQKRTGHPTISGGKKKVTYYVTEKAPVRKMYWWPLMLVTSWFHGATFKPKLIPELTHNFRV
jgi:hypothetical protein